MGEVHEELVERWVPGSVRLGGMEMCEPIQGIEGTRFAVLEQDSYARHPIDSLAGDHVAEDIVGAPGFASFVAAYPKIGQAAEECGESSGRAGEECDGVGDAEFGLICHGFLVCHVLLDTCRGAGWFGILGQ